MSMFTRNIYLIKVAVPIYDAISDIFVTFSVHLFFIYLNAKYKQTKIKYYAFNYKLIYFQEFKSLPVIESKI